MSLAIDRFYDELTELLELPIYVGSTPEELEKEVTENTHGIAVNLAVQNEVEAEDLLHFVAKLKEAAKTEMAKAGVAALSFYLWFEEGQLWYTFVNAIHARMPFSEEFESVDSEEKVIEEYLSSLKKTASTGLMCISTLEL